MASLIEIDPADGAEPRAINFLTEALPDDWFVTTNLKPWRFEALGEKHKKYWRTEIDCVILCPYGIFVVELKNHSKVIVPMLGVEWPGIEYENKKSASKDVNPYEQGLREMYALKNLLEEATALSVHVEYIIALSHPRASIDWNCSNVKSDTPARRRVARISDIEQAVIAVAEGKARVSAETATAVLSLLMSLSPGKHSFTADSFAEVIRNGYVQRSNSQNYQSDKQSSTSSYKRQWSFFQTDIFEYGVVTIYWIGIIVFLLWIVNLGLKAIQPSKTEVSNNPNFSPPAEPPRQREEMTPQERTEQNRAPEDRVTNAAPPASNPLPPVPKKPEPRPDFVFKVCNRTNVPLRIAVSARLPEQPDTWIVRGWGQSPPGTCRAAGNFVKGAFYAAAFGPNGSSWGGRDIQFCVRIQRFEYNPTGAPCAQDESFVGFKRFDVDSDDYTWNLSGYIPQGNSDGAPIVRSVPSPSVSVPSPSTSVPLGR